MHVYEDGLEPLFIQKWQELLNITLRTRMDDKPICFEEKVGGCIP